MAIIIPSGKIFDKKTNKSSRKTLKQIDLQVNDVNYAYEQENTIVEIDISKITPLYSSSRYYQEVARLKDHASSTMGYTVFTGDAMGEQVARESASINRKSEADSNYYITDISPKAEITYISEIGRITNTVDASYYNGTIEEDEWQEYDPGEKQAFEFGDPTEATIKRSEFTLPISSNHSFSEYVYYTDESVGLVDRSCNVKLGFTIPHNLRNSLIASFSFNFVNPPLDYSGGDYTTEHYANAPQGLFAGGYSTSYNLNDDSKITCSINYIWRIYAYMGWRILPLYGGYIVTKKQREGLSADLRIRKINLNFNETVRRIESFGTINETITSEDALGDDIYQMSSDLIRTQNTYDEESATSIYRKTFDSYKNGKETATIECAIGDYYDLNGYKTIDKNGNGENAKMLFDLYDVVIPYTRTSDGVEAPLSVDITGSPKAFEVLGTEIIFDGKIKQKLSLQETKLDHNVYEILYRWDSSGSDYSTIALNIQGKGDIYVDNILVDTVDFSGTTLWEYAADPYIRDDEGAAIQLREIPIKFVGDFQQISVVTYTSGMFTMLAGQILRVVTWYNKTFPYMFTYQNIEPINIKTPLVISSIAPSAFEGVKATSESYALEIPNNINEIGERAFAYSEINTFIFKHKANQVITLPSAGSSTGMFYSKSAGTPKTIYTDNHYIRNYDFVSDNISPIFYHLDGTLWG